jgi:uncharacterized membrane protein
LSPFEIARFAHMARSDFGSVRRPFYPALVAFAAACFFGTLATDIAYWRTANVVWADFSDWLVTAGVIAGYAALAVALVEVLALRTPRLYRQLWPFALGMIAALILGTLNMLVHTRDAWTSVVPWGLALSTMVVVAIITSWTMREKYQPTSSE